MQQKTIHRSRYTRPDMQTKGIKHGLYPTVENTSVLCTQCICNSVTSSNLSKQTALPVVVKRAGTELYPLLYPAYYDMLFRPGL